MKEIFGYLGKYFKEINLKVGFLTSLIIAILIYINYTLGIESTIKGFDFLFLRVLSFFLLYAFIFSISYAISILFSGTTVHKQRQFIFLLLFCPLLFALKVSINFSNVFNFAGLNEPWIKYWKLILNWPLKCLFILASIYTAWLASRYERPVAGMNRNFNWRPYLLLLLYAVPLVVVAAATSDFQQTYPKVKNIAFIFPYTRLDFLSQLVYEISYGTDFLTIESFFRGFVVLAFLRYVGKDAILPMAAFYCTIHFGKPLFECITSYFGGIMLGVIVYNTRSIWGGLIVHLGMAWLMDLVTLIVAN